MKRLESRSFLTGFKKRKDERRKKARESLEQQFREEKARIRQKNKDKMLSRIHSQIPLEEEEEVLESTTIELPNHTVSITEVLEVDLADDDGTRLGSNKADDDGTEESECVEEKEKKTKKSAFKDRSKPNSKSTGKEKYMPQSTHKKKGKRKPLLNPFDPTPHTKPKGQRRSGRQGQSQPKKKQGRRHLAKRS
ncbi:nucleolar protein 12-like isoform X2 [Lineus longissimus]|uniref:nucleolar protein 12-like isoform X2 n=1 Tax=Lineus longissimus TaxID=88925 RepID=UPI002B4C2D6B